MPVLRVWKKHRWIYNAGEEVLKGSS